MSFEEMKFLELVGKLWLDENYHENDNFSTSEPWTANQVDK